MGDDGYLRLWDLSSRVQTLCLDLKGVARCCCYSPDGNTVCVGFGGAMGKGGKQVTPHALMFFCSYVLIFPFSYVLTFLYSLILIFSLPPPLLY